MCRGVRGRGVRGRGRVQVCLTCVVSHRCCGDHRRGVCCDETALVGLLAHSSGVRFAHPSRRGRVKPEEGMCERFALELKSVRFEPPSRGTDDGANVAAELAERADPVESTIHDDPTPRTRERATPAETAASINSRSDIVAHGFEIIRRCRHNGSDGTLTKWRENTNKRQEWECQSHVGGRQAESEEPWLMRRFAREISCQYGLCSATMSSPGVADAQHCSARQLASVGANGFSRTTSLPAASAAAAMGWWRS